MLICVANKLWSTYFKGGADFLLSIFKNRFLVMVLWTLKAEKPSVRQTAAETQQQHHSVPTHFIMWFPMETLQHVRYLHAPQFETIGKWEKKSSIFVWHSMQV